MVIYIFIYVPDVLALGVEPLWVGFPFAVEEAFEALDLRLCIRPSLISSSSIKTSATSSSSPSYTILFGDNKDKSLYVYHIVAQNVVRTCEVI